MEYGDQSEKVFGKRSERIMALAKGRPRRKEYAWDLNRSTAKHIEVLETMMERPGQGEGKGKSWQMTKNFHNKVQQTLI